jgi:hypothetical protein
VFVIIMSTFAVTYLLFGLVLAVTAVQLVAVAYTRIVTISTDPIFLGTPGLREAWEPVTARASTVRAQWIPPCMPPERRS